MNGRITLVQHEALSYVQETKKRTVTLKDINVGYVDPVRRALDAVGARRCERVDVLPWGEESPHWGGRSYYWLGRKGREFGKRPQGKKGVIYVASTQHVRVSQAWLDAVEETHP